MERKGNEKKKCKEKKKERGLLFCLLCLFACFALLCLLACFACLLRLLWGSGGSPPQLACCACLLSHFACLLSFALLACLLCFACLLRLLAPVLGVD